MSVVLDVVRLAGGIAGVATLAWLILLVVPPWPDHDEEWW